MTRPGTEAQPLRVAIVGAGPTGFYATDQLFRQPGLVVDVDMYDRVPTPYGLVRAGVAPDHQKIKSVTAAFDKVAAHPRFRFFGAVELGRHLSVDDLRAHYHMIIYTTGAQTDRRMGIAGEDLQRSHAATEFVAWYNGHPDYRDLTFDLSQERAAVVGVGNVAADVARILSRTPEELAATDIADYALEALSASRIREVYVLGRRGPAQAAFTNPEVRELGELAGADVTARPEEVEPDELTRQALERAPDRATQKKVEILKEFSHRTPTGRLYATATGTLQPKATDEFERLPVGLVFRSVGYRGVPLPGVPFNDDWGVILNEKGRVLDAQTKLPLVGQYTAGWIKRGPTGVIGTNKPDAAETVTGMLEDLARDIHLRPADPSPAAVERLVRERQPQYLSYQDWLRLDEIETRRGKETGRPRVKFTRVKDMLAALGRA
jgi:ferredoxin--NADP+ reductase